MSFAVGSLVSARGREWVVLPESQEQMLILRPLGGMDEEVTGIYLPLEKVEPARFALPDPKQSGDARSCRLLRDAVRLGFRSSAGPFRSFGKIAVEPRPYQLVPLLMALKLDPIRILIADDVGIGKTIEVSLIAREMLDRGEIRRIAVLCLPQLAEQWQKELRDKFHIEAELVLSSTVKRLERNCMRGESIFDLYPFVIISTDFIKNRNKLDEFVRTCPELVIVDEAHTCAHPGNGRGGRHLRYELVSRLAQDPKRHLLLVSATPHSGNENAFRSLLSFLSPQFKDLPEDLRGAANEPLRRQIAAHFIQRRRDDLREYLHSDTPFPDREEAEKTYRLSEPYRKLMDKVLRYARETVLDKSGSRQRQRVRWWSALALLRSVASSPAAAAATLRNRAPGIDAETEAETDNEGQRVVLDLLDDESAEDADLTPGSNWGLEEEERERLRRRLSEMAKEADALRGEQDAKLQECIRLTKSLIADGYNPILFCRFIPTAEYLAEALRDKLPKGIEVGLVTGSLSPEEREGRVAALGKASRRVLVCTDCLSEGINLQEYFDAVFHYDLSWNPTRHEQREGRVDRYGQPSPTVRALTYYGIDTQIDGIVLDVLLRKHKSIRNSLGISVPVPTDSDQVIDAIFEGLILRGASGASSSSQLNLAFDDLFQAEKEEIHREWEKAKEREKQTRTLFAQQTIKVDEVARELREAREAIGSGVDVAEFTEQALTAHNAIISRNGSMHFNLKEAPRALCDIIGRTEFSARFELPIKSGELYLSRTYPIVEGLAAYVMDSALDPMGKGVAKRSGAMRTQNVEKRTTALLVRFRFHILSQKSGKESPLLAEDAVLIAYQGAPRNALWLEQTDADRLLQSESHGNIQADEAADFIQEVIDDFGCLTPHLEAVAQERSRELLEAHRRVRSAAHLQGVTYRVVPQLPPDILGIYVYLPAPRGVAL